MRQSLHLVRVPIALLWVAVLLAATSAWAAETPRKHHPWAAFSPGAWRTDLVIVRVFDPAGKIVDCGKTQQRTVLESVDDQGVTLRIEESVWVAGKWLDRPPQTVRQGLYGESEGQKSTIKDLKPEMVRIEGREIACGVREVEVADVGGRRLQSARLSMNDDVVPFILKRKTTIRDPEKKTLLCETDMVVDALHVPCLSAEDQFFSTSLVRTTTTHAKGKVVSLTYCSAEVPGRIVCECTKKTDTDNRLVEQSVLKLVDCGLHAATENPPRPFFPRRRLRTGRLQTSNAETTEL